MLKHTYLTYLVFLFQKLMNCANNPKTLTAEKVHYTFISNCASENTLSVWQNLKVLIFLLKDSILNKLFQKFYSYYY